MIHAIVRLFHSMWNYFASFIHAAADYFNREGKNVKVETRRDADHAFRIAFNFCLYVLVPCSFLLSGWLLYATYVSDDPDIPGRLFEYVPPPPPLTITGVIPDDGLNTNLPRKGDGVFSAAARKINRATGDFFKRLSFQLETDGGKYIFEVNDCSGSISMESLALALEEGASATVKIDRGDLHGQNAVICPDVVEY